MGRKRVEDLVEELRKEINQENDKDKRRTIISYTILNLLRDYDIIESSGIFEFCKQRLLTGEDLDIPPAIWS